MLEAMQEAAAAAAAAQAEAWQEEQEEADGGVGPPALDLAAWDGVNLDAMPPAPPPSSGPQQDAAGHAAPIGIVG